MTVFLTIHVHAGTSRLCKISNFDSMQLNHLYLVVVGRQGPASEHDEHRNDISRPRPDSRQRDPHSHHQGNQRDHQGHQREHPGHQREAQGHQREPQDHQRENHGQQKETLSHQRDIQVQMHKGEYTERY